MSHNKQRGLVDTALGLLKNDYRARQEVPFSLDDGTAVSNFVSGMFKIEAEMNGMDSKSFSKDQALKDFSLDDDSFFTTRALENIDQTVRFIQYSALPLMRNVPMKRDIAIGTTRHSWQFYDFTGSYKRMQAKNTDLPTAQIKGVEDSIVIHPGSGSLGWDVMEMDSATFANAPLEAVKVRAMRRAYEQNIHALMIDPTSPDDGDDPSPLLKGLMTSEIDEFAAPATGTSSSTLWADKEGRIITDDFNFARKKISTGTKGWYGVVQPERVGIEDGFDANLTLALTLDAYEILSEKYMFSSAGANNQTVLDYLRSFEGQNRLGISQILVVNQFSGKFNSGTEDGFMLWVNDPDVFEFAMPMEMTPRPVQFNGLGMSIPYYDYFGGMILRRKKAIVRINSIIA